MPSFPTLTTGAQLQYPFQTTRAYSTQTIRFVDGTEQRFRNWKQGEIRWHFPFHLLSRAEAAQLIDFFHQVNGAYSLFNIVEPLSGQPITNCALDGQDITATEYGEDRYKVALAVRTQE